MELSPSLKSPSSHNSSNKNLKLPSIESTLIRHPSITNLLEEQSEQSTLSPIESKYTNIPCLKINTFKTQTKEPNDNVSKTQSHYSICIDTCGDKLHDINDNFFIESPINNKSTPHNFLTINPNLNNSNTNSPNRLLSPLMYPSPNRMSPSEQKLDSEITKSIKEGASYSRIEKKFSKYLSISKNQ